MKIEELYAQVFFNLFIPEEGNCSIKKKAQGKMIELMQEMGVMGLDYYDVTRENEWMLSEITSKLNSAVKKHLDNLNILSVQKCCISIADLLSSFSFAIFDPDTISTEIKGIIDGINFLSQVTEEDPKGIDIQEKIALVKEAINLIYFETQRDDDFGRKNQ